METRGEREVRAFFEAAGIAKEIHRFDESTHNSELAARSLGVGDFAIKVYHLENADATTVAPALVAAIERSSGAGGAGAGGQRGAALPALPVRRALSAPGSARARRVRGAHAGA